MSYSAPRRAIAVRVFTGHGWIEGTISIPRAARLAEWLGHAHSFVTLGDVRLEAGGDLVPFVSLRREAMRLVVPAHGDPPSGDHGQAHHAVTVALDGAIVRGTIDARPGVRVSDSFTHQEGFVELHDARVRTGDHEASAGSVLVMARHVVAVSEPVAPVD